MTDRPKTNLPTTNLPTTNLPTTDLQSQLQGLYMVRSTGRRNSRQEGFSLT